MSFHLTSPVFTAGRPIPPPFTGDGPNHSPPLEWGEVPEGTQTFALICEDPDAPRGTWTHWVLFNLPGDARALQEGVPPEGAGPGGLVQGVNDFGKTGYGGPAPPRGKPHRYFFKLYALDRKLALGTGASKQQLLAALKGHVLAEAELMGTYQR